MTIDYEAHIYPYLSEQLLVVEAAGVGRISCFRNPPVDCSIHMHTKASQIRLGAYTQTHMREKGRGEKERERT